MSLLSRIASLSELMGFSFSRCLQSIQGLPAYLRDLRRYRQQAAASASAFPMGKLYPCLTDRHADSGRASGPYFHQDLLVAQSVFSRNPRRHIDVGSRIDGFVAHVAAFRPIEVIDIRPMASTIRNVSFIQADFMAELPSHLTGCCDSVSCLHALEHFGLGRYGDPIHVDGHRVGLAHLAALLGPGGMLYLSLPIGPIRVEFNAHRVFSVQHVLDLVSPLFDVRRFSYVDDAGDLHPDVPLAPDGVAANFACLHGCGIFELVKR